jgi:hypothetical protein
MSSTARHARTAADLGSDIEALASDVRRTLDAALGTSRLAMARNAVAAARQRRGEAQTRLEAEIEAARASDKSLPPEGLKRAAATVEALDQVVRESRIELDEVTRQIAPALVADLRGSAAMAATLTEELLGLLDRVLEPMAEARRTLASHHVSEVPHLLLIAPRLEALVRDLRAVMQA